MIVYQVGGSVRDALLGLPVQDRDWVVVGASPDDMLAQGFRPVGKDFPVFLHPETQEEYALARTERKTGRGHRGFVLHATPDVTLEEDLGRRDLTIKARGVRGSSLRARPGSGGGRAGGCGGPARIPPSAAGGGIRPNAAGRAPRRRRTSFRWP